jgi:hypothetical protein
MADELLKVIRTFDPAFELKYNKFYIGLANNGEPDNFAIFRAKKNNLTLEVRLPQADGTTKQLEDAGLDLMGYDTRWGRYRLRLSRDDVTSKKATLTTALMSAYEASKA